MSKLIEVRADGLLGAEAFVAQVSVAVGQTVAQSALLVAIEFSKATMEITAPEAGRVTKVLVAVNDNVLDGDLLLVLEPSESEQPSAASPPTSVERGQPAADTSTVLGEGSGTSSEFHASPSIRRLAHERGLDLGKVVGSGRRGRILAEDLEQPVEGAQPTVQPSAAPARSDAACPVQGSLVSRPLSPLQRVVARNLTQNWTQIPHVTQFDESDITELEAFRLALNHERDQLRPKLSLLPFVVKATACALATFPDFNSSLVADDLIQKGNVHIGFAVDTADGLRVPVIQHADRLSLSQIAQEIARLADKARNAKLAVTDVQGGSFTISNLGGAGGTAFTPIINAPEVAILGVSKAELKPRWNGGAFVPRLMLPLSLSYDHRVINGVAGARFVAYLAALLSDLRRTLL